MDNNVKILNVISNACKKTVIRLLIFLKIENDFGLQASNWHEGIGKDLSILLPEILFS